MATVVTNATKENMIAAISGTDLKMALLNNVVSADEGTLKDYGNWSTLSAFEITGTAYTAGGISLTNVSAYSNSATDRAYFNGDLVSWPASTITAYGAAIYRSTSGLVVSIIDFGSVKSSNIGTFSVSWNNNKILQMIG